LASGAIKPEERTPPHKILTKKCSKFSSRIAKLKSPSQILPKFRHSFDCENNKIFEPEAQSGNIKLNYRGKSCYCKDCGGHKYYEKFQKKINLILLPEEITKMKKVQFATKYIQYFSIVIFFKNRMVLYASAKDAKRENLKTPQKSSRQILQLNSPISPVSSFKKIKIMTESDAKINALNKALMKRISSNSSKTKKNMSEFSKNCQIPEIKTPAAERSPDNIFIKRMSTLGEAGCIFNPEEIEQKMKKHRQTLVLKNGKMLTLDEEDIQNKLQQNNKPTKNASMSSLKPKIRLSSDYFRMPRNWVKKLKPLSEIFKTGSICVTPRKDQKYQSKTTEKKLPKIIKLYNKLSPIKPKNGIMLRNLKVHHFKQKSLF